jgi:SAM-dependent methyltransferase
MAAAARGWQSAAVPPAPRFHAPWPDTELGGTDLVAAMRRLRRSAFREQPPLSDHLLQLASQDASHAFLTNPAAHQIYVYLARYVARAIRLWFPVSGVTPRVLDWGCGKGHFSLLLKEQGLSPVSADRVGDGGDSAFGQSTPIVDGAGLKVVPLEDDVRLPFADQSFEVVLSVGVLEHVPSDTASLAEITRVLAPRGLFFCFFLPAKTSWTQRLAHLKGDRYHDRLYGELELRRKLARAGLVPLDVWRRQLLPKNSVRYPAPWAFERIDQLVTNHTLLKYLATNLECVAARGLE